MLINNWKTNNISMYTLYKVINLQNSTKFVTKNINYWISIYIYYKFLSFLTSKNDFSTIFVHFWNFILILFMWNLYKKLDKKNILRKVICLDYLADLLQCFLSGSLLRALFPGWKVVSSNFSKCLNFRCFPENSHIYKCWVSMNVR